MKLSVIIVSYNIRDLLHNCIKSIYQYCDKESVEVIVVDNASGDGTIEMLARKLPSVIVISNKLNAGFSEANNQGLSIAKGTFIMLLNPDTELRNDALNILVDYISKHATASIVAPKLLNADNSLQMSCWKFSRISNIIAETFFVHKLFKVSEYSTDKFKGEFRADFASGAALLFRKELINQIGLLDPDLFWMEDVDFCYRAKRIGVVVYVPQATIVHYSGKSAKTNYKISISNQLLSKLKFFKKYSRKIAFAIASFFILLHIISRLIGFSVLSVFNKHNAAKAAAYFYSLKKYFRYTLLNDYSIN